MSHTAIVGRLMQDRLLMHSHNYKLEFVFNSDDHALMIISKRDSSNYIPIIKRMIDKAEMKAMSLCECPECGSEWSFEHNRCSNNCQTIL